MSHAIESKLTSESIPTPNNQYSRGDRIKAVIGTGLGVGGCLGFTVAFAAYGSFFAAAAMFFVTGLGAYASKINLESTYGTK